MEFTDVVRRRRMVRAYADRPVDRGALDRALANAARAPSAGNSQGWAFLVLDDAEGLTRFWAAASPAEGASSRWLRGMRTAPVVVVPLSSRTTYLDRYAEPDKGWTDRDESRWAMPYWHLDTAMAALLILLTAVDEGLGACFFGIPPTRVDLVCAEFGVPSTHEPIGAITLGHRAADPGPRGSAARPRRPLEEVVHRGHW